MSKDLVRARRQPAELTPSLDRCGPLGNMARPHGPRSGSSPWSDFQAESPKRPESFRRHAACPPVRPRSPHDVLSPLSALGDSLGSPSLSRWVGVGLERLRRQAHRPRLRPRTSSHGHLDERHQRDVQRPGRRVPDAHLRLAVDGGRGPPTTSLCTAGCSSDGDCEGGDETPDTNGQLPEGLHLQIADGWRLLLREALRLQGLRRHDPDGTRGLPADAPQDECQNVQ